MSYLFPVNVIKTHFSFVRINSRILSAGYFEDVKLESGVTE